MAPRLRAGILFIHLLAHTSVSHRIPASRLLPSDGITIDPPCTVSTLTVVFDYNNVTVPTTLVNGTDTAIIPYDKRGESTTPLLSPVNTGGCEISISIASTKYCTDAIGEMVNITAPTTVVILLPEVVQAELCQFKVAATVDVKEGAFKDSSGHLTESVQWAFATVEVPDIPSGAVTAGSTIEPKEVHVYGVGVYVTDLAAIDLKAGTFYVDVQVYLLRYYRSFEHQSTALAEATEETPYGRQCKDMGGYQSKWLYLANVTLPTLEDQRLLQFANIGKLPKINLKPRSNADELVGGSKQQEKASTSYLDHFRVQSEFYFAASLKQYPFQTQNLPVTIEMISDSVESRPSSLLCTLPRYSGFAPHMSSFAKTNPSRALSSTFSVSEAPMSPPFAQCSNESSIHEDDYGDVMPPQYAYPRHSRDACMTHASSRLTMTIKYTRTYAIGVLELAPPVFIALSSLVTYFLPVQDYRARLQTCTTSLLAAVVQHSTLRSQLPPQSVLTRSDVIIIVSYIIIFTGMVSASIVAFVSNHRDLSHLTIKTYRITRLLGPSSVLLFLVMFFDEPSSKRTWMFIGTLALGTFSGMVLLHNTFSRSRIQSIRNHSLYSAGSQASSEVNPGYWSWEVPDPERLPDWSPRDVRDWLDSLELPYVPRAALQHYAELFLEQGISGRSLLAGTWISDEVGKLGIPLGPSILLAEEIKNLIGSKEKSSNEKVVL